MSISDQHGTLKIIFITCKFCYHIPEQAVLKQNTRNIISGWEQGWLNYTSPQMWRSSRSDTIFQGRYGWEVYQSAKLSQRWKSMQCSSEVIILPRCIPDWIQTTLCTRVLINVTKRIKSTDFAVHISPSILDLNF